MSRVEAFDQAQQPAPFSKSLTSQSACKNNFGAHIVEGRKEGRTAGRKEGRKEAKNGGRGKKVIITLFYEGGRFQF